MRKKILFGILLTIVAANAPAQYLKLFGNPDRHALYFNTDRLWSYNLYEHSRWGGGLRYSWNNVGATLKSLTSDVYLGYGTADKRWKWGVNVDAALAKPINWHLYASYFDDLIPVGTRHMDTYQLTDISSYTNFMSRRFSSVRRLALGMRFNPSKPPPSASRLASQANTTSSIPTSSSTLPDTTTISSSSMPAMPKPSSPCSTTPISKASCSSSGPKAKAPYPTSVGWASTATPTIWGLSA